MALQKTQYYYDFLRYFEMASWQQEHCNLGNSNHSDLPYDDDLMKNVHLYDVVERKYAGFSKLILDISFNKKDHPHKDKLCQFRSKLNLDFQHARNSWEFETWLYVMFLHRLTGSGIHYGSHKNGYHNSIIPEIWQCENIGDICSVIKNYSQPMFTSKGYQIAPFPKPSGQYKTGGKAYLCEVLPGLVRCFASYLSAKKRTFRECMSVLESFHKAAGYKVFRFQFAAVLADLADFVENSVDCNSHFFYGKNAIECLSYLAHKPKQMSKIQFLDCLTDEIREDTGSLPYNTEDVACDFIRWIENYVGTGNKYQHLDLDEIWSSHRIYNHPYGRQKPMLNIGLIDTFNGKPHPSDDKVLKDAGWDEIEYKAELMDYNEPQI